MAHTTRDHDGMTVLIVSDMDRRYDEDGKLASKKDMGGMELVHASEIAKYYGIPLRTVGKGDNEVPGIWHMVHANEIGLRVPYNAETTAPGDRNVRTFRIIKDAAKNATDTVEEIKRFTTHHDGVKRTAIPLTIETDDGMYVKFTDLIEYAKAQGWKKGGGLPGTGATKAHAEDTNTKLDKLADLIGGLAEIVTKQIVMHQPVKGTKS